MTTAGKRKTQLQRDHDKVGNALRALYHSAADDDVPDHIVSLMRALELKYTDGNTSNDNGR